MPKIFLFMDSNDLWKIAFDENKSDRSMNFDYSTRKMACKSCGLFLSRDELVNLRDKIKDKRYDEEDNSQRGSDYLNWWLSDKKKK